MAELLAPEGKLDVTAVTALYAQLVARQGCDIVLDFESVTQIGALCMQTCLAAARSARLAQNSFEIVNVIDPVLNQLSSMGFTPETLAEGGI